MKVYGQLEFAQFEQIASASPTPAPSGRFYMDVTDPLAHVPKIRVNSTWKTLQMAEDVSGVNVVTASSKTQLIDWSVSRKWLVKLANNVVFSFSNAVENESHTLIIQQADLSGPAPFVYSFNMEQMVSDGAQVSPRNVIPSNGIRVFQWFYKTNSLIAGTALNKVSDKAPAWTVFTPGGGTTPESVDISPNPGPGSSVFFLRAGGSNGGVQLEGCFGSTGNDKMSWIGTFSQTGAVTGDAWDARISPDGNLYAMATGTSPYVGAGIIIYNQKVPLGNARNFTAPTALPGACWSVSWHPTQKYLLCGHTTTPFVTILPTTNAAFGTKLTDPASLPAATPLAAKFSPMGDFFASVSNTSPYLEAWGFTSEAATPIGSKSTNPVTLPTAPYASAASRSIFAWSPFGNWIVMSQLAAPYAYIVSFDRNTGAFGSSVAPAQTLPSTVRSVAFSPDGKWLALGFATTALVYPFNQTSGAMGAALSFQSGDAPSGVVSDICFSADSKWVIMNGTTAAQWPWVFRLPPTQSKYYLYNQR